MAFTPAEVQTLASLGFTPEEIAAKERKAAKDADVLAAVAALQAAGVTQETVATLIESNPPALSVACKRHKVNGKSVPVLDPTTGEPVWTSDWAGTVIGSLPFDDLGVSVKVTITVTDPDAFPVLAKQIEARKAYVKAQKDGEVSRSKLAAVPVRPLSA